MGKHWHRRTKAEEYHGGKVAEYYTYIHARFGGTALLNHLPQLRRIVWSDAGLKLIESHKKGEQYVRTTN